MDNIARRSLEESFAINQNNFEKDILPYYNFLKVEPLFLVQIPIILPFQIPFNQGTCSTFELQDGEACTFHFSDVNLNEQIYAGIVNENSSMLPVCKSRVEMTYVLNKEIIIPPAKDEDLLSILFDRMIEILNWIILSYLISFKDTDVYRISREMLEPASIVRIISIAPWEEVWRGLFLTHTDIPYVRSNITQQDVEKVMWYSHVISNDLNPFILSEELSLNAKRYFKEGFYKEAIFYVQTSFETFINALFSKILEFEGFGLHEIQTELEEKPFISIVKKEIHRRLGGSWDINNQLSKIGRWHNNTYLLRNRIAHAGYIPSIDETSLAISCVMEARSYIIDLIFLNKNKYPDLSNYFIRKG